MSSLGTPFVSPAPWSPLSFRASYHATATKPVVGSREILGLNWLVVPVSSLTLTGVLHVAPSLSEYWTMTSVLLLSLGVSCVHRRYTRPSCVPPVRSYSSLTSMSIDRPDWAGM